MFIKHSLNLNYAFATASGHPYLKQMLTLINIVYLLYVQVKEKKRCNKYCCDI